MKGRSDESKARRARRRHEKEDERRKQSGMSWKGFIDGEKKKRRESRLARQEQERAENRAEVELMDEEAKDDAELQEALLLETSRTEAPWIVTTEVPWIVVPRIVSQTQSPIGERIGQHPVKQRP